MNFFKNTNSIPKNETNTISSKSNNFFNQNPVKNNEPKVEPKKEHSEGKPQNHQSEHREDRHQNHQREHSEGRHQLRKNIPISRNLQPKIVEVYDLNQNIDILYIDKRIQLNFMERRMELSLLYRKLDNLDWLINNGINKVEKATAIKLHRNLYDYINDVLYNISLNLYLLKTAFIIEKYKKMLLGNNSFFNKGNTGESSTIIMQLKLQFLMIVAEYINLKNFKLPTNFKCIICGKIATGYNKDSYIVCECGVLYEILDDSPNFKDTNRVNMASRYKYSHIGHFKEAMNRFEGKQSTGIDDKIIENIEEQITLKKMSIDTVTKEEVYEILISLKYSDYYADINLIYFKITKKSPPDITSLRIELLELLEFITEAYEEIFGEIDNSLNINWILYKLLQIVDFKCIREDFFCLKTSTKEGEYMDKWAQIIKHLKEKYPEATTSKGKKRWRLII